MSQTLTILNALRIKDYTTASKHVAKMLEQKMSACLAVEKKNVGHTLIKEAGNIFPAGWDTGWEFPYSIGGGGSERPFLKDGKWNIRVYNKQTGKHETYSYSDDIFYTDAEFYGESFAQNATFARDEKVVLAHCTVFGSYKAMKSNGARTTVPIGSTGNYVRKKDDTWSIVWFPDFYESAEIRTVDLAHTDRGRLWDEGYTDATRGTTVGTSANTNKAHCAKCGSTWKSADNSGHCIEAGCMTGKYTTVTTPAGKVVQHGEPVNEGYPDTHRLRAASGSGWRTFHDEPNKLAHGVQDRDDDDPNKLYPVKKNGKTVWVTVPPSNNEDFGAAKVCKTCKHPLSEHSEDGCEHGGCKCLETSINEEAISQYEVQRVYDEVGDIGETEILCGVRGLRVTPQGQVISYICEAASKQLQCSKCGEKFSSAESDPECPKCGATFMVWLESAPSRYTEAQLTKVWKYASSRKNDDKREYALQCLDQLKASGKPEFDDVDIPKGLGYMGAQDNRTSIRKELSESVVDDSIGLEASSLGFGPGQ